MVDCYIGGNTYAGRRGSDAPDADTLVYVTSPVPLKNGETVNVLIEKAEGVDLFGKTV